MDTINKILSETEVPVVAADRQGCITFVNDRFETVFGWTKKEIIGKPLTTIIPQNLHASHHLGFSRFLVTGKPTLLEKSLKLKAVSKNGKDFDAEHFIAAEQRKEGWIFAATIRPL